MIVTENASDFAAATACPVLLVRKAWWPSASTADMLAGALDRWANVNADPGSWAHWLPADPPLSARLAALERAQQSRRG